MYDSTLKPYASAEQRSAPTVYAAVSLLVSVRLWEDADIDAAQQDLAKLGKVVAIRHPTRTIDVEVASAQALEQISALKSVRYIRRKLHPSTQNSHTRRAIGVDVAWQIYALRGSGVVVGMWDGALASNSHPSLKRRVSFGETPSNPASDLDRNHATHVAGTLIGTGLAGAEIAGGRRQIRLVPGSIINKDPTAAVAAPPTTATTSTGPAVPASPTSTLRTVASLPAGLGQFAGLAPASKIVSFVFSDHSAEDLFSTLSSKPDSFDVVNNSWGFTETAVTCDGIASYTQHARDYDAIINGKWDNTPVRRILVVFAAGNVRDNKDYLNTCGGIDDFPYPNYRTVLSPGTAKNVITVGAIDADSFRLTTFSGYGPTRDGRLKPEVVAPGCRFRDEGQGIVSARPEDDLGGWCGTSMAAPAVSGLIALIIEKARKMGSDATQLYPSSYKALLVHAAKKPDPGPDYRFGYGWVEAPETLALLEAGALSQAVITAQGAEIVRQVTVPLGSGELKVTFAWDDAPADPDALGSLLVNDLDLVLVGPTEDRVLPWVLRDLTSPAVHGVDSRNVVEQVSVAAPAAGTWRILIKATRLGLGTQPFSLVISAR